MLPRPAPTLVSSWAAKPRLFHSRLLGFSYSQDLEGQRGFFVVFLVYLLNEHSGAVLHLLRVLLLTSGGLNEAFAHSFFHQAWFFFGCGVAKQYVHLTES